jgi:hypothetical protein
MSNEEEVSLLRELVLWTRFLAREPLQRSLRDVLTDPRHQWAYELTDGERTQTDIASAVQLDQTTISDLWAKWRRLGLLDDRGRRPSKLISLNDLGWDLPRTSRRPKK